MQKSLLRQRFLFQIFYYFQFLVPPLGIEPRITA